MDEPNGASEAPPAAPPARIPPPSGWRVTLVLLAIAGGIALVCLTCLVGYMYFIDLHR